MDWQAGLTLAVLALVMGLLVATRVSPDAVLAGGLTLLLVAGVLTPAEALAGMANPGMITVAVLFVVAAGLRETGAVDAVSRRWLGYPRSEREAQARIVLPVAVMSAWVNNTPLVAMMIPVVADWARQCRLSVSRLYIPLSYGAILGGLCTLLGTSTSLVVNGLLIAAAQSAGGTAHPGLPAGGMGLLEIAWVGLPCALAGTAYLLLLGRRLLPDRRPAISVQDDPREYTLEMLVEPGSPLVGSTIEAAGLRHLPGCYLMEIDREGRVLPAVGPEERLAANDRLVFVGVVESVVDLGRIRGLVPAAEQVFELSGPRSQRTLIEAVVSNTHPMLGRTVRDGRFRTVYNAAIVAVARNGERLRGKIGDVVLQAGDTVLLEAHPSFVDQQRNSRDFFLVSRLAGSTPLRHEKSAVALAILVAMVAAAGFGLLSMLEATLLAAGAMLIARCVPVSVARSSVEWPVLIVIAAALGIGTAIDKTGLSGAAVSAVLAVVGNNPWLALAAIYAVTMLATELITNNAAAALAFPFALATAADLGVSPMPFVAAIMIAASCGFATPLGYQTHLMVFGPGGYSFRDFLRIGAPLDLLMGAITVAIAPLVWPF